MSGIHAKVISVFQQRIGLNFKSKEVKDLVLRAFPGTNPESVIPSDYCYNKINADSSSFKLRLFVHEANNTYTCLGENAAYTGPVYWKQEQVGQWSNGVLDLWKDPRK